MAKQKKVCVCPMCAYDGDTTPKELLSSHVIPRNTFRALSRRMGPKLNGRYIEMSSQPDNRLHVTQEQGDEPMLCWDCEQRLSTQIEKPTRNWINDQTSVRSVDADSVLLARYAASVWWRAMLSKHKYYQHVVFDPLTIRDVMEASLNPNATLKKISFRIRKFTDSSGGFSDSALLQYQATVAGPLLDERLVLGNTCFAVIHEGFAWEGFVPRFNRKKIDKLKCFRSDRSRYALRPLDFSTTPALLSHGAHQYSKYVQGRVTPTFERVYSSAGD